MPAPRFNKKEEPIIPIVRDVQAARAIAKGDYDADERNRIFRNRVQAMGEGQAPWDQAMMKSAGLGSCCNIDWGYGKLSIRKKMIPYVQALNSLQTFMRISTKFGSKSDRITWGRIMSQEHHRLLKFAWRPFIFRYLYNVLYFTSHGVGFCYFKDSVDWRWNVSTLGYMIVDRLARADSTELSRMSMFQDFTPPELYDAIRHMRKGQIWSDEENECGWHKPSVIRKLELATDKDFWKTNDWDLQERTFKNLETYYSRSGKVCSCILQWLPEVTGEVTQYIFSEDPLQPKVYGGSFQEDFIYKFPKHLPDMASGCTIFARDIGTNGDFHSIRGTGSDIYQIVQKLNQLKCRWYDITNIELSMPLRATEEALSAEDLYMFAGPYQFVKEGVTQAWPNPNPNYSRSVIPSFQMMRQDLMDITGGGPDVKQPGSKMDLEGLLGEFSGIDIMESTLFGIAWDSLMKEQLRRLRNCKDASEPGGVLAYKWREWCMSRGVPKQAIDEIVIEESMAVRPIGNGSPQAQLAAMTAMKEMMPHMDEEGRYRAARDYCYALPGMPSELVDDYFPEKPDMRPGVDVRFAIAENFIATHGGEVFVLPNDDHIAHLDRHIPEMQKFDKQVKEGQADEADVIVPMFPLWEHSQEHEKELEDDPVMGAKIGQIRKDLQNLGETITNGQRKFQARQLKAKENAEKGLDENGNAQSTEGGGLTQEQQLKLQEGLMRLKHAAAEIEHKQKMMQLKEIETQQKISSKERDAKQKLQLADIQNAIKISQQ